MYERVTGLASYLPKKETRPRAISSTAARTKLVQRAARHIIIPSKGELPPLYRRSRHPPVHSPLTRFLLRKSQRSASWGAFMANTDKAEPVSSESSQDAPEAVTLPPSEEPLHTRVQSPVPNPEHPYTNLSLSTTPDHPPASPAVPSSSAAYSPFAIPHPKRFNAVNINKKFLQKNSSSAATSVLASLATAAKAGSPARMSSPPLFFVRLTSPSSTTSPSALHFAFQAGHCQAHLNRSIIHNHWSRLVPPFICNSTRLCHAIGFVECTTIPATRINTRPSVPSCWQSHTAPTKECHGLVVSVGQEGYLHKTCLGKRKVSFRNL